MSVFCWHLCSSTVVLSHFKMGKILLWQMDKRNKCQLAVWQNLTQKAWVEGQENKNVLKFICCAIKKKTFVYSSMKVCGIWDHQLITPSTLWQLWITTVTKIVLTWWIQGRNKMLQIAESITKEKLETN